MTQEDKLQLARDWYNDATTTEKEIVLLKELFPELTELTESEDERIRKSLVEFFGKFKPQDMWDEMFSFGDVLAYLEKQKPVVWSEEDETMVADILDLLDPDIAASAYHEIENWLKSLRPHPHWKPAAE